MFDIIMCVALAGIVLAAIRVAAWKIADNVGQRKQNPSHDPVDISRPRADELSPAEIQKASG